MKKTFLFIAVLFFAASEILAQTDRGSILVGGSSNMSIGSSKSKVKDDDGSSNAGSSFNFNFSPVAGFFLIDNLVAGASIPVSFSKSKSAGDDPDEYKSSSFSFNPFVRYYIGSGKIKPFGHADFGFGQTKSEYNPDYGSTTTTKYGTMHIGFGAGAAFFVNEKVSFDASLGFSTNSMKAKEDNPNNSKSVTNNFGLNIGVSVIL